MSVGILLNALRANMDRTDELNRELSALKKNRYAIERDLIHQAESAGLEKLANDRLTVSVREELNAGYDPDHWNELIRWAVEHDAEHIIQRRLSSKPIQELAATGVALPDFIRLEPVTRLNVRRR